MGKEKMNWKGEDEWGRRLMREKINGEKRKCRIKWKDEKYGEGKYADED